MAHYGERAEKYVLRVNIVKVAEAIELNLHEISIHLEQAAFITYNQRRNIIDTMGLSPANKAGKLLNCIEVKVNSDTGEKWLENFVDILVKCTIEVDLVKKIIQDFLARKPEYKGVLLRHLEDKQDEPKMKEDCDAIQDRHPLDFKPTLKQLTIMKTKSDQKIEIIKSLAPCWKNFGVLLEFDDDGNQLELIESENGQHNPHKCCQAMMRHWIAGNGEQPTTWRTLLALLKDDNRVVLAQTIQTVL